MKRERGKSIRDAKEQDDDIIQNLRGELNGNLGEDQTRR